MPTLVPVTRPLTERIFARLPGPRAAWVVAWAVVPWLNAGLNLLLDTESTSAVWEQSRTLVILNYAALSLAIVIALWGSRRIAARADALRPATALVLDVDASSHPFREMSGSAGPLVGAGATAAVFAVGTFAADGFVPALLRGATWLVLGVALWTLLWTYGTLQAGLDRLGRERLRPEAVRVDPGLGLRPLGDLAFTGLWLILAALVPVVLTGLPDVVGVVLGSLVLGSALLLFFLSLLRLHRQMIAVKARELAFARELYAEAYEPVRAAPTLETLERQQPLLAAAGALEQRAQAIHDWPLDEGTFARVLTIATSVVAITIGRLILDPFGL